MPTLIWPREIPIGGEPADVAEIVERYGQWLSKSPIPKLLVSAEPGALLTGRALEFFRTWPNQQEVSVKGIHYIQEDSPVEIGTALQKFVLGLAASDTLRNPGGIMQSQLNDTVRVPSMPVLKR